MATSNRSESDDGTQRSNAMCRLCGTRPTDARDACPVCGGDVRTYDL